MTIPPRSNVLIACRDPNFGGALASAADTGDIHVKAVVDSVERLIEASSETSVDVVVAVDPKDFPPDEIVAVVGDSLVLVIGPVEDPGEMIASVEAGALGYVDEKASLEDLVEAMRTVASGAAVVPPLLLGPLLRHVVERQRNQRRQRDRLEVLSPRERQVFELTARGFDKQAVASHLFISPATARTHVQNVFRKLDLHSSADLVALAAACGLEVGSRDQRRSG